MSFGPTPGTPQAASKKEFLLKVALGWGLLLTGAALSIASYFGVLKPIGQDSGAWFARSGAVVTVMAIYAERVLSSLAPRLNSEVMPIVRWMAFPKQICFLQIIVATIVWGYGDLLI